MFYVYVWSMQIEIWSKVCFHGYRIPIYLFISYCACLLSRTLTDKGFQITLNTWRFLEWTKLFSCLPPRHLEEVGKTFLVKGSPRIPEVLQNPQAQHLLWRIKMMKMIKTHHNWWVNNWNFSFCLLWDRSSTCCPLTIRSHLHLTGWNVLVIKPCK